MVLKMGFSECVRVVGFQCIGNGFSVWGYSEYELEWCSLVPRPSLSLSSAITILEVEKKELVKREEGLVKLIT